MDATAAKRKQSAMSEYQPVSGYVAVLCKYGALAHEASLGLLGPSTTIKLGNVMYALACGDEWLTSIPHENWLAWAMWSSELIDPVLAHHGIVRCNYNRVMVCKSWAILQAKGLVKEALPKLENERPLY